jgi:hypothetical protein
MPAVANNNCDLRVYVAEVKRKARGAEVRRRRPVTQRRLRHPKLGGCLGKVPLARNRKERQEHEMSLKLTLQPYSKSPAGCSGYAVRQSGTSSPEG